VRQLGGLGVPLWLDGGFCSVDQVHSASQPGVAHLIVGLETLSCFDALDAMCAAASASRIAFSLDLKHGEPVRSPDGTRRPEAIAARAAAAGAEAIIVLDLARVGTGCGPDFATIARIRQAVPATTLLAGGGVRGYEDLGRLAESGCDGALVATALHDGRLTAADVAAAAHLTVQAPRDRRPTARSSPRLPSGWP
jgi:phosphoribosylformimino-5-aminoimidazole carboxamide ribotide isomerase